MSEGEEFVEFGPAADPDVVADVSHVGGLFHFGEREEVGAFAVDVELTIEKACLPAETWLGTRMALRTRGSP